MIYYDICKAVEKLQRKYCESDPFLLCKAMKINLLFEPLGTSDDAIKGFYIEYCRRRTITINSDLPKVIQRIICAHELGHAVLHRSSGIQNFHEINLLNSSGQLEKEANLFAAEFLLDDDAVINSLDEYATLYTAASKLRVPVELLNVKFHIMRWKGFDINESPIASQNDFLKDIEVPEYADYYE